MGVNAVRPLMLRASLLAFAVVVSGLPAQANWMQNIFRGGKYPSMAQADEACDTWSTKGPKVSFRALIRPNAFPTDLSEEMRQSTIRKCKLEHQTNQFLGYQSTSLKDGDVVKGGPYVHRPPLGDVEVKRNFRY